MQTQINRSERYLHLYDEIVSMAIILQCPCQSLKGANWKNHTRVTKSVLTTSAVSMLHLICNSEANLHKNSCKSMLLRSVFNVFGKDQVYF